MPIIAALKIDPNLSLVWGYEASAYNRLGKFSDAVDAADEAVAIDPGNVLAWTSKGTAETNLGNFGEAVSAYDQALKNFSQFQHLMVQQGIRASQHEPV